MTTIKLIENGPAVITANEADEPIHVMEGNVGTIHGNTVAICRCGKSNKIPYCDGSHKPKPIEE